MRRWSSKSIRLDGFMNYAPWLSWIQPKQGYNVAQSNYRVFEPLNSNHRHHSLKKFLKRKKINSARVFVDVDLVIMNFLSRFLSSGLLCLAAKKERARTNGDSSFFYFFGLMWFYFLFLIFYLMLTLHF